MLCVLVCVLRLASYTCVYVCECVCTTWWAQLQSVACLRSLGPRRRNLGLLGFKYWITGGLLSSTPGSRVILSSMSDGEVCCCMSSLEFEYVSVAEVCCGMSSCPPLGLPRN